MTCLAASLLLSALAGTAELPTVEQEVPEEHLVLDLAASKARFVLHEPVAVVARVKNPTVEPIEVRLNLDQTVGLIQFAVSGPDGKTLNFKDRLSRNVVLRPKILEPGAAMAAEANLSWDARGGVFPTPGEYRISFRLQVANRPEAIYLESNAIQVRVEEPAGADAEAIAFFESPEALNLLLRDGLLGYCENRQEPDCTNEIRRFLEAHAKSAYAPRIMAHLAQAIRKGKPNGPPDLEAAIVLCRQFLKTWPGHADAANVLYRLAWMLDESGRLSEAAEAIQEYERRFPEYRQRTESLRLELKAGKMLESSGR